MPTGECLSYSTKLGWGHIRPDDLGDNVFVHQRSLHCRDGFRKLVVGQRVQYEIEAATGGGKPQAVGVTGPGGAFLDDPVFGLNSAAPVPVPNAASRAKAKMLVPRALAARMPARSVQPVGGAPSRALPLPSSAARPAPDQSVPAATPAAAPSATPPGEASDQGGVGGAEAARSSAGATDAVPKRGASKRKRSKRRKGGDQSEERAGNANEAVMAQALDEQPVAPEVELPGEDVDERPRKKKKKQTKKAQS